jgi:hypothetical protein
MNDQTSPTAGGQGQGSTPWHDPFHEPQGGPAAPGEPGVPALPALPPSAAARPETAARLRALLHSSQADLLAFGILTVTGIALGLLAGLAWYRFAPTVWLTIPADAITQVKANVDQSALLVSPEAKGIASVDGYYFVITAVAGLLLGVLGFWLGRRGFLGGRDGSGQRRGAGVGAWAGVLVGGGIAATLAAALGRWISLPDPLTVLRTIAAGHNFHAPVALHAQGLYLAAPVLGTVLFLALTAAFTKPAPPDASEYGRRQQMFFSSENPYGFPAGGPAEGNGRSQPQEGGSQPGDVAHQADPFRN